MSFNSFFIRNRDAIRFCILFLLYLLLVHLILSKNWLGRFLEVSGPIASWAAWVSASILSFLGWETQVQNSILIYHSVSVHVAKGCDGIVASMIYFSAVMAFPATMGKRILGLALGFLAIQILNILRIITLFLTLVYLSDFFEEMHVYVTQSFVIAFGVVLWYIWAEKFAKTTSH